ncbi:MAG: hypothetical protein M3Z25_09020 [Actinomycetota bacterium]|nr:hypothetical protein [Actinomycetota bacterium]
MRLRVLTINVQNEEGDPRRLELLNRELRRLDPDIVALQEVIHTPEHGNSTSCSTARTCTEPIRHKL